MTSNTWKANASSLRGGAGHGVSGRRDKGQNSSKKSCEDPGFAQFLKQHSSPKHHRVTAGGRIVPMGSKAPPPEWKLAALKAAAEDYKFGNERREPSMASRMTFESESSMDTRATRQCIPGDHAYHAQESTYASQQSDLPAGVGSNVQDAQNILQTATLANLQQQLAYSMLLQNNVANLQALAMASGVSDTYTSFSGLGGLSGTALANDNYVQAAQSVFGGQHTLPAMGHSAGSSMLPQLGPNMQTLLQSISGDSIPQTYHGGSFATNGQASLRSFNSRVPSVPSTLAAGSEISSTFIERSMQAAEQDIESLTSQLSNLDRYLAMHTYDIDSNTKQAMVMQRVGLVTSLNRAREEKDEIEKIKKTTRQSGSRHGRPTPKRASIPVIIRHPGSQTKLNVEAPAWKPTKTCEKGSSGLSTSVSGQESESACAEASGAPSVSDSEQHASRQQQRASSQQPETSSSTLNHILKDSESINLIYKAIKDSVEQGIPLDEWLHRFQQEGASIVEKKMLVQAYQQIQKKSHRCEDTTRSFGPNKTGTSSDKLKIPLVTSFTSAWSTGSVPAEAASSSASIVEQDNDQTYPKHSDRVQISSEANPDELQTAQALSCQGFASDSNKSFEDR